MEKSKLVLKLIGKKRGREKEPDNLVEIIPQNGLPIGPHGGGALHDDNKPFRRHHAAVSQKTQKKKKKMLGFHQLLNGKGFTFIREIELKESKYIAEMEST